MPFQGALLEVRHISPIIRRILWPSMPPFQGSSLTGLALRVDARRGGVTTVTRNQVVRMDRSPASGSLHLAVVHARGRVHLGLHCGRLWSLIFQDLLSFHG